MYYNEENTRGGLIKSLLLRLLLIIIFILILVWLFPTKNSLNPLYQGIFRDNLDSMKEAAETYFTNERLPEEVGKSTRMTLGEMLDENLILPFTDKNGNSCSLNNSYVEITKKDTEYELKVNLSCPGEEAYIIEHMGCTNKCPLLNGSATNGDGSGNTNNITVNCNCNCNCCGTTGGTPSTGTNTNTIAKEIKEYEFKKEVANKIVTGYSCPSGYTLDGTVCKKEVTATDTRTATPVYKTDNTTTIIGYRCDEGYTYDESSKICKKVTTIVSEPSTSTTSRTETINATVKYEGKDESIAATPNTTSRTETINATAHTSSSSETIGATPLYSQSTVKVTANQSISTVTSYLYKYQKQVTTTKTIQDTSKPIRYYTYDNVIGYYTKKVCTGYKYFVDQTSGTLYQSSGDYTYSYSKTVSAEEISSLKDTATTHYVVGDLHYEYCAGTCTVKGYYNVNVYTRSASSVSTTQYNNLSAVCTTADTQVPIYGLKITFVGYETSKVQSVETLTEWSTSKTDSNLTSQNYGYVGIRKENGTTTQVSYSCPAGYEPTSDERYCSKTTSTLVGYTCPTGYNPAQDERYCVKQTSSTTYTCPAGYNQSSDKKTCSRVITSTSYSCPAGYNQSSDGKTCHKYVNTIVGYTCPTGYNQSSDQKTCSKVITTTSYSCPTDYNHNQLTNKCVKTTTETKTAIPVYQSSSSTTIIGYMCDAGYTLNGKTCYRTTTSIATVSATASYKTVYGIEYMWSTETYIAGWTRTGNERTRTIYVAVTSDTTNKQK